MVRKCKAWRSVIDQIFANVRNFCYEKSLQIYLPVLYLNYMMVKAALRLCGELYQWPETFFSNHHQFLWFCCCNKMILNHWSYYQLFSIGSYSWCYQRPDQIWATCVPISFEVALRQLSRHYTRMLSAWQSHGAGKVAHACQRAQSRSNCTESLEWKHYQLEWSLKPTEWYQV